MSIASGGAAVTVTIDDLTAPGLRSALRNLSQLENATKRAGAAATRASASIQRIAGRGFVMQPFSGGSRLELLNQVGGNQITPMAASPYALSQPGLDAIKRRAEARQQMRFGAREVGFLPPSAVTSSRTVAESMRLASESATNLSRVGGQIVTRFLGIGVALGALDIGLRTAGKALVESLADPSKDFWSSFSDGFSETARQIPILGGLLQVLFAEQFAAIDRIKAETEEIAKEGDRRRAMVEARNQGSADSARNVRLSELAVDQARLASSSRGFETEESLQQWRQLARQRAAIEAEEFERQQADRARREGVSEASVGAGAERFRQLREESRIRAANALELIEIEYRERLRRAQGEKQARLKAADDAIKEEAAKRLAAEREVAARVEELQLDQQDRLALARLDAEEASVGSEDTVQNRVRQAEIAAQRELISLQQQLDQAEARILDEKGLTAEQRNAAIEAERQIAELQAQTIREGVERVRRGEDRAEQVAAAAGAGTFSSFAAGRINTDTTALMKQQVKYLQTIASNTKQQAGFAP